MFMRSQNGVREEAGEDFQYQKNTQTELGQERFCILFSHSGVTDLSKQGTGSQEILHVH